MMSRTSRRPQGWRHRGTRARLRIALETKGGVKFAAGEIVILRHFYRGWYVASVEAPRRTMSRVSARYLEFLDPPLTAEQFDGTSSRSL